MRQRYDVGTSETSVCEGKQNHQYFSFADFLQIASRQSEMSGSNDVAKFSAFVLFHQREFAGSSS
jgi:hypothetical protein